MVFDKKGAKQRREEITVTADPGQPEVQSIEIFNSAPLLNEVQVISTMPGPAPQPEIQRISAVTRRHTQSEVWSIRVHASAVAVEKRALTLRPLASDRTRRYRVRIANQLLTDPSNQPEDGTVATVQRVEFSAEEALSGYFSLALWNQSTTAIPVDAGENDMATALLQLAAIDNVFVQGATSSPGVSFSWLVTFTSLAGVKVPKLEVNTTGLAGRPQVDDKVSIVEEGGVYEVQRINIPVGSTPTTLTMASNMIQSSVSLSSFPVSEINLAEGIDVVSIRVERFGSTGHADCLA